jgi:hypothetical protein
MASLQAADFSDLITTTLPELGELKFTDLMSDYQNTIALKRLIKKNKTTFEAGPSVRWNIITDTSDSARFVGMGEPDIVNIKNVMTIAEIPWRHITWNWAIEGREIAMNRSPRRIVDLLKVRRIAAFGSAIIRFESAFWQVPPVTDTVSPFGIPYYVVKSATAATAANANGFTGLVPSGYTVVATLNPTTVPRWANYADAYTAIAKDDLIRKMRRMAVYTDFMPLVDETPTYSTGDDYGYYSNYSVVSAMEELLEAQNDDLGNDVASMDGSVLFRRVPITFVKFLDNDTTNPIYSLNWGELKTMGLRDWWMKETVMSVYPGQHTLSATFTDATFNMLCRNRRRQGVISNGTTMPALQ